MNGLRDRIRARLRESGKAARRASLDGGLSPEAISTILRKTEHSPTLETIAKLAKGLDTSPPWLAYGLPAASHSDPDYLVVNKEVLKQILVFVLTHEGVADRRAALIADTLPAALSGPPVDAVERDPFLSFRVHYQLEARRSGYPEPQ